MKHIDRFFKYVNKTPFCWFWIGAKNTSGYGKFSADGKQVTSHRWLFEQLNGLVNRKLDLDHLCRNRHCVNPAHLEPVTRSENTMRGIGPTLSTKRAANITHCKYGHEFTEENTGYKINNKYKMRRCLKCHSIREANRRLKLKQLTKELI